MRRAGNVKRFVSSEPVAWGWDGTGLHTQPVGSELLLNLGSITFKLCFWTSFSNTLYFNSLVYKMRVLLPYRVVIINEINVYKTLSTVWGR